jgi:hypothetical protein
MRSMLTLICAAPILMACQSGGPSPVRDFAAMEQCTVESGFTARADAARAAGATGKIFTSPEELAAINACVAGVTGASTRQGTGLPQTSVSREVTGTRVTETRTYGTPPGTTPSASGSKNGQSGALLRPRQCNLQMTGGTGYTCANGR